ncbi:MAG: hypothetical protein A2Y12_18265 [Planctomycetes bacterium GWF2_42_9]|nr:MAG: hypothetical protein A2Y12_18265 [Planctomycetes bacterium GWF2_42_9]
MIRYNKFDLKQVAKNAHNFLTTMVDKEYDCLPYWFVQINENPAYAKHVRVDDAELVASWYEAIVSIENIIGADDASEKVKNGFKKHLMKSWGKDGLRYHEDYPWSNTNHSAFHEMSYILGALNRVLEVEPGNVEAEKHSSGLVRAMRDLVFERKVKTFWSGDFPFNEKIYEFPGDVYLRDGGFVPAHVTGRGEEAIRNGMVLHSIVVRAEKHNDHVALDLAEGLANHILGLSRYFSYNGEFFGHVHSAVWAASGIARLGRLLNNEFYIEKANAIYNYVKSISSSFGWVPEYAKWHPMSEEFCETCCIKDMIQCSLELIDCGYDYWDVVNKYVRNQLAENQITDGSFIAVDNSIEDANGYTYKDIDKRVVGGWSGGAEPNSISLQRFRSIAGCCVGTAPQALDLVWERIITKSDQGIFINLPIEKEDNQAKVEIGYPNEGFLKVTAKNDGKYFIRTYDWMGEKISTKLNNKLVPLMYENNCIAFDVKKSDVIELSHELETKIVSENFRGRDWAVTWRGPDVVELEPSGAPLQLYQRREGMKKDIPLSPGKSQGAKMSLAPTEQKKKISIYNV